MALLLSLLQILTDWLRVIDLLAIFCWGFHLRKQYPLWVKFTFFQFKNMMYREVRKVYHPLYNIISISDGWHEIDSVHTSLLDVKVNKLNPVHYCITCSPIVIITLVRHDKTFGPYCTILISAITLWCLLVFYSAWIPNKKISFNTRLRRLMIFPLNLF